MNKLFAFLFIVSFSVSCQKESMGDCFKSTGKVTEEERSITAFESIEVYDRINIYITYAPELSLRVKAGENLQDLITTEVKNGNLLIENTNKCNWVRSLKKEIDVYISTPNLTNIEYYGAGQFVFENTFITESLFVNMWKASGDLNLNVECNKLELKSHTGTGTITCEGTADDLVAFIRGNGFVDAIRTPAKTVLAVNENTGYVKVNAIETLNADIRGSGNIEYTGEPTINLNDMGKGELIKK